MQQRTALIFVAGLACGVPGPAHNQTIATHRLPAALALEAVEAAVASCTNQGYGGTPRWPCLRQPGRSLFGGRPPSLVRSVTLLAAGGLIVPPTPLGTAYRNATEVKMNGSDCVTVLGARWLSPASDPKILAQVECWPAVFVARPISPARG